VLRTDGHHKHISVRHANKELKITVTAINTTFLISLKVLQIQYKKKLSLKLSESQTQSDT